MNVQRFICRWSSPHECPRPRLPRDRGRTYFCILLHIVFRNLVLVQIFVIAGSTVPKLKHLKGCNVVRHFPKQLYGENGREHQQQPRAAIA